jgi:hypothetical protein
MREAPALTPTASPRLRRSSSTWPPHRTTRLRSRPAPHQRYRPRAAHRPLSVRFEPVLDLRGFRQRFLSYAFSSLLAGPKPSDSAGPSRTLSGLLPPSRAFPRPGCPQLHQPAATDQQRSPLTPARFPSASWRTVGFQNSAEASDLRFQAAGSYSLINPPRTGRRPTLRCRGSATEGSGRGGCNWSARCGRRVVAQKSANSRLVYWLSPRGGRRDGSATHSRRGRDIQHRHIEASGPTATRARRASCCCRRNPATLTGDACSGVAGWLSDHGGTVAVSRGPAWLSSA